jgi:hypothetical protein
MQRQKIFKRNEIDKLAQNPKFISSVDTDRLLKSKISRLESQKKYDEKRKQNGNKPLRQNVIERLQKENKMLKTGICCTIGMLLVQATFLIYLLIK